MALPQVEIFDEQIPSPQKSGNIAIQETHAVHADTEVVFLQEVESGED